MKLSPKTARFLFFLLSLVVFLGSLYVVYRGVTAFRESRMLADIFERIDSRFESERYQDIPGLLDDARRMVSTPRNALRLLKRAYRLAVVTEDFTPLFERALRWHRRFVNDGDIAALAVYSVLAAEESGEHIDALRLDERFFDKYPFLGAAVLLARGESTERTDFPYALLSLGRETTPSAFFEAADETDRFEFAVDGVLQLASSGFLRDARITGQSVGLEESEPYLMALLAYDLGMWTEAARLLGPIPRNEPDALGLRGDVMYLAGDAATARNAYQALFRTGEPHGPLSYNNAAVLAATADERRALIEEGLRRYPGNAVLVAALFDYVGPKGAENHLSALRRRVSGNPGAAADQPTAPTDRLVHYLLTDAGNRPPDANAAQLWSMANSYPEDVNVVRYTAWYLAEIDRLSETRPLLIGSQRPYSRSLVFYRGLYHNGENRKAEAFRDFRSAHQGRFAWQAAYNAAAIALELGRFDEGLEIIGEAEIEPWYRLTDQQRSRLKLLEARINLRQGRPEVARDRIREALALAPGDTAAIRLYNALEE